MTEWKLFTGDTAEVSTAEFHRDRERAPHLEQPGHRDRLLRAADFVKVAAGLHTHQAGYLALVADLGCGDGGLLSVVRDFQNVSTAWGYDFAPANAAGWTERGVIAEQLDVFGADRGRVVLGDITIVTEVLEHLTDPHDAVRWIAERSPYLVASSPWNETDVDHDECHAWAFDMAGYRALIEQGGYQLLRHEPVGRFQVVLGRRA
jgi:hypothetical protein